MAKVNPVCPMLIEGDVMKKHIRQILKFVAVILVIQALSLLVLTPSGLELIYPLFVRVNAEKFVPETNTYAVYYDTRVSVSNADLIIVGVDYGVAESFDLLGHFTRFVKQYNDISAVLLDLTLPQQIIVNNLLTLTEEESYVRRISILEERTGLSEDYCDYISEIFYVNRTMPPTKKLTIDSYAELDGSSQTSEPENMTNTFAERTKTARIIDAYDNTPRTALCVTTIDDLSYNSNFRREMDHIAKEKGLNIMYIQTCYDQTTDGGEGHHNFYFLKLWDDSGTYFVCNQKLKKFYDFYDRVTGRRIDNKMTKDRLSTRFTDYYFVVSGGGAVSSDLNATDKN